MDPISKEKRLESHCWAKCNKTNKRIIILKTRFYNIKIIPQINIINSKVKNNHRLYLKSMMKTKKQLFHLDSRELDNWLKEREDIDSKKELLKWRQFKISTNLTFYLPLYAFSMVYFLPMELITSNRQIGTIKINRKTLMRIKNQFAHLTLLER